MQRNRNRNVPLIAVLAALLSCSLGHVLAAEEAPKNSAKAAETARAATAYGEVVEGLQIKLDITDDVIGKGESAILTITMKNRDKEIRTIEMSDPAYDFVVYIKGPDGKTARIHRDEAPFFRYMIRHVKPGETLLETYPTDGLYRFDSEGSYRITATREVGRLSKPGTAIVTSNTVVLHVVKDRGGKGAPESASPQP